MTTIHLVTRIKAPIKTVFDASRDIDVHQKSTAKTNEKVIAGISSGLINLNETVTWKAKHFGLYLIHKSKITTMNLYDYFVDEMVEGKFKSFKHEHIFEEQNGITTMTDTLCYETPYGILGKIFDVILLKKHLTHLLIERNSTLKILSEKQELP